MTGFRKIAASGPLIWRRNNRAGREPMPNKSIEPLTQGLNILIGDSNAYMRRLTRTMLMNLGAKSVTEAGDGLAALEAIRIGDPDIVVLEWDMPVLNGMEVMRIVRSPGVFPMPDIPIIMLTAHGERWRIVEAVKLGVNEFLCKPVSAKSLLDRLLSILLKPRENIQLGEYYGPVPRHPASAKAQPEPEAAPPA